ncbi:F0F1 ATP synthase subunit delta [Kibdelosporangium philippinense]|uniref:ATP synthase subunit delta n=1 Tax=Kibdelosporangium philippinense TaxID=211113 RepID=A0ABS8ZM85_9PSEU|nr:F0F1 ATP synthase subunit delta [Kibdelosporangium philippinense]MCE7008065.1 F0F1 ATP synthase subunit delta [Kibdelosporangium philippinense]
MTLLHAASREALAATELKLLDVDDFATVGDELFAVVGLLTRESGLRRALADSSAEAGRRTGLVRQLFASKLSAATVELLDAVVTARWSNPRELVDGIESLARTALLVGAERAGKLDTVEDELFRLGRIVAANGELERLLSDPAAPVDGKLELLRSLAAAKVDATTEKLSEALVAYPRGRRAVEGLEELADLAAKRRERSVAHVTSVAPLTEAQQERLAATLQRIYARPIALHIEVDKDLLGGLVIRVGDEVIDGSAAGRLDDLRRRLAS